MTDGNTAIQVSPTEEAMHLSTLFSKAADAIVKASTLPAEIEALRARVNSLESDLDKAHMHSTELDRSLQEVRTQRDTAEQTLSQVRAELEAAKRDAYKLSQERDSLLTQRDTLRASLEATRQERDDHGIRVMELEDEVGKAKSHIKEFRDRFAMLFPDPKPEPEPMAQPEPEPVQAHPESFADPTPAIDTRPWWEQQQDRVVNQS